MMKNPRYYHSMYKMYGATEQAKSGIRWRFCEEEHLPHFSTKVIVLDKKLARISYQEMIRGEGLQARFCDVTSYYDYVYKEHLILYFNVPLTELLLGFENMYTYRCKMIAKHFGFSQKPNSDPISLLTSIIKKRRLWKKKKSI